jgi:hypothetical protein
MRDLKELGDKFEVKTTVKVEPQMVQDLLCNAFEGGSGYWCRIKKYDFAGDITRDDMEFPHLETPFYNGCAVIIDDVEGDPTYSNKRLDWPAMQKGLEKMAEKYPHHWDNFINDNADAETGDVFLQLCIFDDITFG